MSIESAKAQNLISESTEGSSLWRDAWIRLRANRLATFSLFFLFLSQFLLLLDPKSSRSVTKVRILIILLHLPDLLTFWN